MGSVVRSGIARSIDTFTPGIAFDGASVGMTFGVQVGVSIKIGSLVIINGRVSLTNKGSSTGDATITGLPFTSLNVSDVHAVPDLHFAQITFANQYMGQMIQNQTTISLLEITEAGVRTALNEANFANNSDISFTLAYRT